MVTWHVCEFDFGISSFGGETRFTECPSSSFVCLLWFQWQHISYKGKGKIHLIAPLRSESTPQKRSGMTRVLKGFQFYLHTHTFIRIRNEPYACGWNAGCTDETVLSFNNACYILSALETLNSCGSAIQMDYLHLYLHSNATEAVPDLIVLCCLWKLSSNVMLTSVGMYV